MSKGAAICDIIEHMVEKLLVHLIFCLTSELNNTWKSNSLWFYSQWKAALSDCKTIINVNNSLLLLFTMYDKLF